MKAEEDKIVMGESKRSREDLRDAPSTCADGALASDYISKSLALP